MVREIAVDLVRARVQAALAQAVYQLPADYLAALAAARAREQSALGQSILLTLTDNAAYAQTEQIPTCQDTGMVVMHLEVGQDVHFGGGDLTAALNDAVRQAYAPLRKSVADPLSRVNTGDNTPALINFRLVPGDGVTIHLLQKGFGAELMSRLAMLTPAAGLAGARDFVLETVNRAGPNACPPIIVGVGLGSSFDGVAALAKKALLRPLGRPNGDAAVARLEAEWLVAINDLGIGPQGLGGTETALAVHIETFPTHIAALPVAVNLNCSAPRRATIVL